MRRSGLAALAALALAACASPGATPSGSVLDGDVRFAAVAPDAADHVAARLAGAALVTRGDDRMEVDRALESLVKIERILEASGEADTGLVPVARDLRNATLDDPDAYLEATGRLLESDDVDPAMRARLERFQQDDPLALANARVRDAWILDFGRAFNTLVEPVGKSIMNTAMVPYHLAQSVLTYAIQVYLAEPLGLQRRQALKHWKDYLKLHPEGDEAGEVALRVQRAQARWNRTQRDRMMKVAEQALDADAPRIAAIYSDRALRYTPEDSEAAQLRDLAEGRVTAERLREQRSVSAPTGPADQVVAAEGADLARALLDPSDPSRDAAGAARALLEADPGGPLADEALFSLAVLEGEAGHETLMWEGLEELEGRDSNMARHAAALVDDQHQNPYGAYRAARTQDRWNKTRWVLFGPWANGVPRRGLPLPVEWALGLPRLVQTVGAAPLRVIQLPWTPPFPSALASALYARRYLKRYPDGEYTDDVREWLIDFESDRENKFTALALMEASPDADPEEIAELREEAAEAALEMARREKRRDARASFYRRIAREFQDTAAGFRAGQLARAEVEHATPQEIRITRGFLLENPDVAGPAGLAIQPRMFDDDAANSELHDEGVALLGGSVIEISVVSESGDKDDPPTRLREKLSEEHLARLVSRLEEASFRNSLVDPDDALEANAKRDRYFEKVRLGVADDIDPRPAAGAQYTYRGMRERYGVVRSRESILPFDVVISGSLDDMTLGAFPRIRPPRETPDAILYK